MWFPKFVTFVWSFSTITLELSAFSCPKGYRVEEKVPTIRSCVRCPAEFYYPEENESQICKQCLTCQRSKGSEVLKNCTRESDTKCKCRKNFSSVNGDPSNCKCASGFTEHNTDCIKVEEKAPTQKPTHNNITRTTMTTITATAGSTATTKEKMRDSPSSSLVVGLTCLMVGLLALTVLLCKQNILSRMRSKSERNRDSSFRTPVEESGHSCQDPLKQNQEEP